MNVRAMTAADYPEVGRIYKQGIKTQNATFRTEVPSFDYWDAHHHIHSRLVAEEDGKMLGWVAISPFSSISAYQGVAEVSLYIDEDARGKGVGTALMHAVIEASEAAGIWTLHSQIFPENTVSLKLHHRFGFREVGRRERIGQLAGVWRDTILLERRSQI
ncbi:GNAT family N-acetyltransferase [Exiguobacterium antarcticum]|uniref:N-acetyltransferase family protein n=1 Tax=Exiguobacterium antarcticum TaxID=132920 RepID=A0ABT6R1R6_9BACL|nr:GNAT family N-acetyltransferase [Exiguobacterium antarcticum]AFS69322.1 GCN5-related N-acetyltransferase [Exiguobacterium antarcticum B7]MDI3234893.1 N-acetyltransferase family protein [Exiguobacterium antarcticum]